MSQLSQLRRADASSRLVLLVVCAGVVLASLDLFIVNVALPDMAQDLGTDSLADLSWVLNAYAITYAALLLLFGRMAERRPRDLGFLLGVALFTVASAACAAADSLGVLVLFRILQAAGAALLTPTSLGLILATTEPERRQGAVRVWTAVGGAAAALGPVVGGLLVAASLALGVPGQRAGRPGRARRRLAAAAARPGPRRAAPGRARRRAGDRRRGRADARPGQGRGLGLEQRLDAAHARRSPRSPSRCSSRTRCATATR